MKSNFFFKTQLFLTSIVGAFFSISIGILILSLVFYTATPTIAFSINSASIKLKPIQRGLPISIQIPSIKIDAPIRSLGLTSGGAMDTTKTAYDVAWFKLGPKPGQTGSAVIAGHNGLWKNGAISVFHDLNKLRKGDKLYIKDDKGVTITFVVRESKIYLPNADTSKIFSSNDDRSHLNLITCVYDKISKTYPQRLVVFTDKE